MSATPLEPYRDAVRHVERRLLSTRAAVEHGLKALNKDADDAGAAGNEQLGVFAG